MRGMEAPPPPDCLTAEVSRRLRLVFKYDDDLTEAERLLVNECGRNLPFSENASPEELERVRVAALKQSGGSLESLRAAIELAKVDFRDLLMASGFGYSTTAHLDWLPPYKSS